MALFNFNYEEFELFLFVFVRVGAIIIFTPILGSASVPAMFKVGLILFASVAIFPAVSSLPGPLPKGTLDFGVHLLSEITIGLTIAFAARLVFMAVQVAGTVVDFQMGFGVVNVIDPQTQSQVSVTAQFQNILAILIFLAVDAHHFFLHAVVESFDLIDPNRFAFSPFAMEYMMTLFANAFVIAIKISAPAMAALFFVSISMGLIARTVPQMNVFIVAFPLQIGMGLLMVGLTMAFFTLIVKQEFLDLPLRFVGLMRAM
ncbi:MAG: flagellar biosynthetic protein FliR [Nitrospinales bacterium]